jgi:hypothetical protein
MGCGCSTGEHRTLSEPADRGSADAGEETAKFNLDGTGVIH